MNVVAIVLAAGEARRFGAPKQTAELHGRPLIQRAVRAVLDAGLPTRVVIGAHAAEVRGCLVGLPVSITEHAGWADGLGSSVAAGVVALDEPRPDAVLLCLGDQPGVDAGSIRRLLDVFEAEPERIVASDTGVFVGPPCIFPSTLLGALEALRGDQGARSVLRDHADAVIAVSMPEAADDVDTPADLERFQAGDR
ncbi:nucleotidyltransferase family protein [uncultured Abyssibacter sp.]|uniref:nucleotidyltransferase family protein n=1 Tax=uncultured Abyssibacter sp. TaxID=2320202 RepID=UPI0032B2CD14